VIVVTVVTVVPVTVVTEVTMVTEVTVTVVTAVARQSQLLASPRPQQLAISLSIYRFPDILRIFSNESLEI
jgi:hypothetical protein